MLNSVGQTQPQANVLGCKGVGEEEECNGKISLVCKRMVSVKLTVSVAFIFECNSKGVYIIYLGMNIIIAFLRGRNSHY